MKVRVNRVATDCIALTFDANDIHVQEKEATVLLEIGETEGLVFDLSVELQPEMTEQERLDFLPEMTQAQIEAEIGAYEYLQERGL